MIVLPAIDLLNNQCVRLKQGDYNAVTVYSNNPKDLVEKWILEGAEYIHIVDLNGANQEFLRNKKTIHELIKKMTIPIQVGGGIRDENRVKELLELGVSRVILGTLAIENPLLLKQLVGKYGEQIVVGVDAREGKVATRGWKKMSHFNAIDFCKELHSIGVRTIVYTDIVRDGMMGGPNFEVYRRLVNETSLNIIASGGVSSLDDLKKLSEIGVYGTIIGKALYENEIKLKEAVLCSQNGSFRV